MIQQTHLFEKLLYNHKLLKCRYKNLEFLMLSIHFSVFKLFLNLTINNYIDNLLYIN